MLPIGSRPILWHIMKIYAHHGHKDFILCLGYKGEMIKDYFRNYAWNTCDATLKLGRGQSVTFHHDHNEHDWSVTLADTGENSMTAHRLKLVEKYLGDDADFLLTYGDGVGDIDITRSIAQHRASGRICTLAAVRPPGRFGELSVLPDDRIMNFNEKPQTTAGAINGGFMVCRREMFDHVPFDPGMMLEQQPLKSLAAAGQLEGYRHDGFWQPMDTFQEFNLLNTLWAEGRAPWKVWQD